MDVIEWDIGVSGPISPDEPLPPLPVIPTGGTVVVTGRAPIWRYCMACHLLHGSAAAVIATNDPKLGRVVVVSHKPGITAGQLLPSE